MILPFLLTLATVVVLLSLIALVDSVLQSFTKSLLIFFTALSGLYQIGFIFHFPPLFWIMDATAILVCFIFGKRILKQWMKYADSIFIQPWKKGERLLYVFYGFFFYLFFLSIVSVPGLNWDGMVYHLARPFLYLHEGTIFTPHYADARQVAWPMGADVLNYIFMRYGGTFGVGFFQFLFYIGILLAAYRALLSTTDSKTATTLFFITASIPSLIYSATTEKNDMQTLFAFVMMWISFRDFQKSRKYSDLFFIFLALAFGLACKVTFLFLGPISLLAFYLIEKKNGNSRPLFAQDRPPLAVRMLLWLCFLFLMQTHLYIYNFLHLGYLTGDESLAHTAMRTKELSEFVPILGDFIKYQLTMIDFALPFSTIGIPFVDTFLSFLYNHTLGGLAGEPAWYYQYMPDEMRASFGPFGIFILWGIYRTLFGQSKPLPRALAYISVAWMLFVAYKIPWGPVSGIRYYGPIIIASIFFLPKVYENSLVQYHKCIRIICVLLMTFCCVVNYAKPLIAYHPKAIPWYRYTLSDRGYFYHNKYFMDDRMNVYQKLLKPGDKVFVFSYTSDWVFPYYQYAGKAKVRLGNYEFGRKTWSQIRFEDYNLIVCNTPECIADWDQRGDFEKVWQNSPPENVETNFIEKKAAFYKPK
ncbi:MAG: glycosyltransferase family 39 protein [Deltaproteobacteria bacterium]|nr:glycosyltransferase family 39 protein [Deltaproteobacteria bacterium]